MISQHFDCSAYLCVCVTCRFCHKEECSDDLRNSFFQIIGIFFAFSRCFCFSMTWYFCIDDVFSVFKSNCFYIFFAGDMK